MWIGKALMSLIGTVLKIALIAAILVVVFISPIGTLLMAILI